MRWCAGVAASLALILLAAGASVGEESAAPPVATTADAGTAAAPPVPAPEGDPPPVLHPPAGAARPLPKPDPPAAAKPKQAPSVWEKVPPVPPLSRIGYFTSAPGGPGYYSLLDLLLDHYWLKPPRLPYPPTASDPIAFYDADYGFLNDPRYRELFDPFYRLKGLHPGEDWMFSFGGEERVRYMDENGGYARFTGQANAYELIRTRLYGDLWFLDRFRLYAEMQDSRIANNDLPPLGNDVDHADFLNLFADAKLFEWEGQPAYVRVGRQELYFGSQRLISPSDFPNVRRTFQGVRGFWRGRDWDVDAFWVQPVLMQPTRLDPPDHNQGFAGLWLTHRPTKGQTIDLYYLNLDNSNPVAAGRGGVHGGLNVSTVGGRYAGDYQRRLLWDFEGMWQFGDYANQRIAAGSITTGLGYRFADVPTAPQFWLYWDRASGDPNPGTGSVHRTFNQLFPWGHTYFGYLDLVGRENIDDVSVQGVFFPARWVTLQAQYHVFRLVSARDALYNASGVAIRRDPTGRAGTDVGEEIDLTANFHLDPHQDVFLGFSHLFAGPFVRQTGPNGVSPSLFYLQYNLKF